MSWVEDLLTEAFLSGGRNPCDFDAGPEVAQLGWEYDRSSGFYFHRSLGERLAEKGGVFFDDSERKFYFFDEASMKHAEMNDEQLIELREFANNAAVQLPLCDGEERAPEPEPPQASEPPMSLEDAWSRPWDEWVDTDGAGANLELLFFADKALRALWALAKGSSQVFHYHDGGYELCGAPVLHVRLAGGRGKLPLTEEVAPKAEVEVELNAGDSVVGSGAGVRVPLDSKVGVSRQHCVVRYHPGQDWWQVKDLGSVNGTLLDGRRLPANEWAPLDTACTGSFCLRVGQASLQLTPGEKLRQQPSMTPGPATLHGTFEINPELLPPPPLTRAHQLEFNNRLRKRAANRLSNAEQIAGTQRADEYTDRAAHRRATRVEWGDDGLGAALQDEEDEAPRAGELDDTAGAAQRLASAFSGEDRAQESSEAMAEANLLADGSFAGASSCGPRAGIGYSAGAAGGKGGGPPESQAQKRRRIALQRYHALDTLQSAGPP